MFTRHRQEILRLVKLQAEGGSGYPPHTYVQHIGNDLHHVLTQAGAYVGDMEKIATEKTRLWKRRPTALF
jgi:hypothetical protein